MVSCFYSVSWAAERPWSQPMWDQAVVTLNPEGLNELDSLQMCVDLKQTALV